METLHKSKHHKHFYIEFDSPPNFYYTDGDAVEGRCVLLSARDEDVVAITLSFHGTVKTHITRYTYSKSTVVQPVESYSESVLFQEKKLLYQGTYTLRKNVLYEWTFRFKVPRNLPPSGRLGKVGMGSGQITYELEAARTTTGQDLLTVEHQIGPENNFQLEILRSGLFKKLGTFTGMVAAANIDVLPARPK